MPRMTVDEAQTHLKDAIGKLAPGEELLLTDNETVVAKVIALPDQSSDPPQLGTLKGTVLYMDPDFNAPIEQFEHTAK